MTKIVIDELPDYKGGDADGYYMPYGDEIHVLNGHSLQQRALIHECVHAERSDKITFRLACAMAFPIFRYLAAGVLALTSFVALVTHAIAPFLFMTGLVALLVWCQIYEEATAQRVTRQRVAEEVAAQLETRRRLDAIKAGGATSG